MKTFTLIISFFIFLTAAQSHKEIISLPHYDSLKFLHRSFNYVQTNKEFIFKENKTTSRVHPKTSATFDTMLARRLQQTLDNTRIANNIIGGSAAIIMPREGTWLGASGLSNPVTDDSVTTDMLFGIGSISKSFCATMILKLQEEAEEHLV